MVITNMLFKPTTACWNVTERHGMKRTQTAQEEYRSTKNVFNKISLNKIW
jgi:hypothetical protein